MPDERATFEQQLRTDPDDVERWTVYADWLLARGDRRGELIMLECTAETQPSAELSAQITALRDELDPRWLDIDIEDWDDLPKLEARHRRGVIWALQVSELAGAKAVGLAKLLASPSLRLLSELELVFDPTPPREELLAFLERAELGRLLKLRCAYCPDGPLIVHALARHDTLALRELDLRYAGLTDDDLRLLARIDALAGLRTLHLQHNRIGAAGVGALAGAAWLRGLEYLDLRYNPIGPAGAAQLGGSPDVGQLRTLLLDADEIEAAGMDALAGSTSLGRDLVRLWRGQRTGTT
jgi:uncharacterized protein (TIGR02996 family)